MPITETSFGPKSYLTLVKSITTGQITDKQMYDDAGKTLAAYIEKNDLTRSGPWSVLYFSWDEAGGKAEIGIAFPLTGQHTPNDPALEMVEIPKSKASMDTLRGPYEGLGRMHRTLMDYIKQKSYNVTGVEVMAIEEYTKDPTTEPNPQNWETNIYYLHN